MLQHDADAGDAAAYQPGRVLGPPGGPEPDARGAEPDARGAQPEARGAQPGANAGARKLNADDRAALGMWAAAYLALLVLAWASAWAFRSTREHAPLTSPFEHWDAVLLRNIAQYGYFSGHSVPHNVAFFPGYPMALSVVHVVARNWVLSELLLSAVAGCFVVVSLTRLANGRWAVLYMMTTPAALFLLVGYSETLFLALAIPAWLAATRGRWWHAALLAGLAGLVRPDGLFLIPALVLMALTGRPDPDPSESRDPDSRSSLGRARLTNAATASLALAGPAAYELYLRIATGSWLAWSNAMRVGWDLHLTPPVQTLKTTWWAAFEHPFGAGTAFEFQLELVTMAAMVVATLAFCCWQRWPEATYCGLAVVALGTSTWYSGCPRTLLVLFPIWVALSRLAARWPWIRYAYLGLSAPLAVVLGTMYLSGQWAG